MSYHKMPYVSYHMIFHIIPLYATKYHKLSDHCSFNTSLFNCNYLILMHPVVSCTIYFKLSICASDALLVILHYVSPICNCQIAKCCLSPDIYQCSIVQFLCTASTTLLDIKLQHIPHSHSYHPPYMHV